MHLLICVRNAYVCIYSKSMIFDSLGEGGGGEKEKGVYVQGIDEAILIGCPGIS